MLRCFVQSPPVPVGKNGWKKQIVLVHLYDGPGQEQPYATPVPILVGPEESGYGKGEYTLDTDACIRTVGDKYGQIGLGLGRLVLVPSGSKGKA